MFQIKVTTERKNELGLLEKLLEYADGYGFPAHIDEEQARAMLLDSFTRKTHAELQMMEVSVKRRNPTPQ